MAPRLRSLKSGDGEAEFRRPVGEDEEREEQREEEEEEEEDEEEVEQDEEAGDDEEEQEGTITEYEKQRLKTIERNKAMLASLQLPNLASSLAQSSQAPKAGSASKSKGGGPRRRSERLKSVSGKKSAVDDDSSSSDKSDSETESLSPNKRKRKDQEYEPTDDEGSLSESEEEMDEHEVEALQKDDAPGVPDNVDMDEEEYALQQALALSLGASVEATNSPASSKRKKKKSPVKKKRVAESVEIDPIDELEDNPKPKPSKGKAKRKNQKMGNKRRFTEGEVDALFPFFDERGRGMLTLNDLERVSTTHDFTWSAEELLDMIHLFSRNHTGALDLVDFRNVATRCNLILSER